MTIQWTPNLSVSMPKVSPPELLGERHVDFAALRKLVEYSSQFAVVLTSDAHVDVVAEICFTNIASSLTPLGNPQNILLWQASGISAEQFVLGTWRPIALSGVLTAAALYPFRRRLGGAVGLRLSPCRLTEARNFAYTFFFG